MNDFTKEELYQLYAVLCAWMSNPIGQNDEAIKLANKLQSMIDSYCEHSKCIIHEVNKPDDLSPNTKCYKCKSEFYVHPMCSGNSDFILNCDLHRGI